MATQIVVQLERVGPTTSEASVRSHRVLVDRPEAKGGADRGAVDPRVSVGVHGSDG